MLQIFLLLYTVVWFQSAVADWTFIENEEDSRVWVGEEVNGIKILYLDEEVEEYITVAYMSYTGSTEPVAFSFTEPSTGSSTLGLVFQQNTSTSYWGLVVTERQDYESSIFDSRKRYAFKISADGTEHEVILNINNIDDNPPILQTVESTCTIPENYLGQSNCTYTITDLDGWISYTVFEISGRHSEESLFEFRLEDYSSIINGTHEANLILWTIEELDFETRSIYFFDLTATDSGNNVGSLKVYIEVGDEPDEDPTWTSIFAALQFDEKTSQTFQVTARDGDIGLDWEINYWLTTDWPEYFSIDNQTGVITISPIDRDALDQSIFSFIVFAYEVPDPTAQINQSVTVIVNDINDNYPEITVSPLTTSILENRTVSLELNISISDIDSGSYAIYTVELRDISGQGYEEAFQIIPSQGYQTWSFYISVADSSLLDYENEAWQEISFQIYSQEIYDPSHYDIQTINVSLINWNDEQPIFEESEISVWVNETIGNDEFIATVYAEDRDIGDTVTHSLLGTAINRLLTINSTTGDIITITDSSFDYERTDEVIVQVRAVDSMNGTSHSAIAQLTIYVLDINDETPSIRTPSEIIEIEENQLNGTLINEGITATDEDTTANLIFFIDWSASTTYATKNGQRASADYYENSIAVETVNISSGSTGYARARLLVNEIIQDNTPDYEMFDTLYITLYVVDLNQEVNRDNASVVIAISIIDVNDNAPVFSESSITANNSVTEGASAGTIIGTIRATDADGVNFNVVSYSLRERDENTTEGLVVIDSNTGQLTVNISDAIDADIPIYYLNYIVTATDGYWETEANISIFVIDINDNAPVIESNFSLPIEIFEKSDDGTTVTTIEASDADRDSPHNTVFFTLSADDEEVFYLFSVGVTSGVVIVDYRMHYQLDRDEGPDSYTVGFTVADNYLSSGTSHSASSSFKIQLLDINDQVPMLYNTSISTSENVVKGECIGNIVAFDRDEPGTNNTRVNFTVLSISMGSDATLEPPDDNLFTLTTDENYETQIATVCAGYDLEGYYGTYNVEIQTNDFGTFPQQQFYNQTLAVVVDKYNFRAPTITHPANNANIYLAKSQSLGSRLFLYNGDYLDYFTATDNQNEKWNIQFSVSSEVSSGSETSHFTMQNIGRSTAQLVLSSFPNYDASYTLTILADCQCTGDEPFTDSVVINVRFFDENSEPYFTVNNQALSFPENTTGLYRNATIYPAVWNTNGEEWDEFPIYYHIISDTTNGAFELDSTSRVLTLISMLDREEQDTHTLIVQASQSSSGSATSSDTSHLTVTIEVEDVNDNPPNFESPMYFGGVMTTMTLQTVVVTLVATDLDIDILTYSIDYDTLTVSDSSLSSVSTPFTVDSSSGEIFLNFQVQANMLGYFSFNAIVTDLANHTDTTSVKIYVVADSNRVTFTFENTITTVNSRYNEIRSILQNILEYVCNIETIQAGTDSTGNTVDTQTNVITHFIDQETNEVIQATVIQSAASNLVTFARLRSAFLEETLYLLSLVDDTTSSDNSEAILRAWLIALVVILFVLCIVLLVTFIIRTRSLSNRLNKLNWKFGSQESGLNRIHMANAPNTNKHAIEGSNPVYNVEKRMPDIDTVSISSGDSDLIGIEDNPNFDMNPQNRHVNPNPNVTSHI